MALTGCGHVKKKSEQAGDGAGDGVPAKTWDEDREIPHEAGTGKTYFVSASAGKDDNDGLSEQKPLRSIARVSQLALGAGDVVRFKCGDTWRAERLDLVWSGERDNFLVFTSYPERCEDRPALVGSLAITGWAKHEGAIYVADLGKGENAGHFPKGINQLFRTGKRLTMGRWPNLGEGEAHGYSRIDAHDDTRIEDAALPAGDWTGAVAHIRGMRWYILNREVTASAEHALTLAVRPPCYGEGESCKGWGYFLNNHLRTLDRDGEWFHDAATNRVYLVSSDGAPSDIEGSVVFDGESQALGAITLGRHLKESIANVAIENLSIRNWFMNGITTPTNWELSDNENLIIRHNEIRDVDDTGIALAGYVWNGGDATGWRGGHDLEVTKNTIIGANQFGIDSYAYRSLFYDNDIEDIALIENVGRNGIGCGFDQGEGQCTESGDGIRIKLDNPTYSASGNTIERNHISRTGYTGIDVFGPNNVIKNNVIEHVCITKGDCGGVRTFGRDSFDQTALKHIQITGNIIRDVPGNTDGCAPEYEPLFGMGLYIDMYSDDVVASGNTISGCTYYGILYQNSRGRIVDNVVFDGAKGGLDAAQVAVITESGGVSEMSRNTLVALAPTALTLLVKEDGAIAKAEDNAYAHPSLAKHIRASSDMSLADWQKASGLDQGSKALVSKDVAKAELFSNDRPTASKLPLDGSYRTLAGEDAGDELALEPYSSEVLLKP